VLVHRTVAGTPVDVRVAVLLDRPLHLQALLDDIKRRLDRAAKEPCARTGHDRDERLKRVARAVVHRHHCASEPLVQAKADARRGAHVQQASRQAPVEAPHALLLQDREKGIDHALVPAHMLIRQRALFRGGWGVRIRDKHSDGPMTEPGIAGAS